MPAANRIKPTEFFSRDEWRAITKPSSWMGIALTLHAWAIIAGAIALSVWSLWFLPLSIALIGARQLGLTILMHDAAHNALHPNEKINDFLGHWLGGALIGGHLWSYRAYHLKHHKFAQQDEDPDLMLAAHFPITRQSLRRKVIRDLTGQTFWKQRKNQFGNALGIGIDQSKGRENRSQTAREAVIPMLITNAVLFTILAALGLWWTYFVLWLLPMATWNMMITRLRNIAEHACVPRSEDPLHHARTTIANPIEGLLIAPYWVNYHCEHHMFMYVPCYRLGTLHKALRKKGITDDMEVDYGYWNVLKEASNRTNAPATAGAT